jgi:methylthioribose-1-phosphate isomerase
MQVMTHCNAGSLATAHWGTALGVIYSAQEAGRTPRVWVRETRPVLQGSRLTMWELMTAGVPCKLVADSVAAMIMRADAVDMVIVGADRIAANGDVANKIGTYGLAVLAKVHDIPFYVAAPSSTVDMTTPTGSGIDIEERDAREIAGFTASADFTPVGEEVRSAFGALTAEAPYEFPLRLGSELMLTAKERSDEWFANELKSDSSGGAFQLDGHWQLTPQNADVFNPAFDITPADLVTGIITENGIASPPYEESLADMVKGTGAFHELKQAPEATD